MTNYSITPKSIEYRLSQNNPILTVIGEIVITIGNIKYIYPISILTAEEFGVLWGIPHSVEPQEKIFSGEEQKVTSITEAFQVLENNLNAKIIAALNNSTANVEDVPVIVKMDDGKVVYAGEPKTVIFQNDIIINK